MSATDVLDHLVVSEVVTGGASASDELIELYNPTAAALPLEGLELIYVSSTGATITRRAAWALGAPSVPAGGHVLVANEAGIFASIADAVYASGMAATGGSVALRIAGAGTAIDAVGWGTAASTWREGANAAAPSAGASIERLPGGALGSTQDTDDNA
ncbi:MAG TPA: lamin tail domain-containing protein, partial [Candidatus Limnocylindria bacterium]|nr:lamin tail domain-containing protein [Candidatus Limnocylindria bacterium]